MPRSGTRQNLRQALCHGCIVALVLTVSGAQAQQAALTNSPPVTAGVTNAASNGAVDLDELRDPFWPVGYKPAPPVTEQEINQAVVQKRESVIDWPKLQLAGLTRKPDGSYMALIRGLGWVSQGDPVICRKKDVTYRWLVEKIDEQGVRCTKQGAILPGGFRVDEADAAKPAPSPGL